MILPTRKALELAPSEDQGTKVFIDRLQQRLCGRMLEACIADMLIATIAVDTNIISEVGFTRTTESLNREDVAFFHALIGLCLDERNLFVAMDVVAQDIVTGDVSHSLDRDGFAVDLNLVAFHHLLDGGTDVVDPSVNTGFLRRCQLCDALRRRSAYFKSGIGSCFHSRKQVIIDRIGSDGESAINDPSVHVYSEIDLQDIVVLQEDLFRPSIGRPVGTYVVQAKPRWKPKASFERVSRLKTLVTSQCSNTIIDLLSKPSHRNSGLSNRLGVVANLAMNLRSFAIVDQEVIVHVFDSGHVTDLFGRRALEVVILHGVIDYLALRISAAVEQVG
jgi:hypothetical protein